MTGGQARARSLSGRLGAEEWDKNVGQLFRGDAGTTIGDRDSGPHAADLSFHDGLCVILTRKVVNVSLDFVHRTT